jgi:hypothetical protein
MERRPAANELGLRHAITRIVTAYNEALSGLDERAIAEASRAYGGVVRAGKGGLVETIAASMAEAAWVSFLGQDQRRITVSLKKSKIRVPLDKSYRGRESLSPAARAFLSSTDPSYGIGPDVQVLIDDRLVLPIECKAYTEIAMFKRILVDATLMKRVAATPFYGLVQLESMLGGDYCDCPADPAGSASLHTLMSYFDVALIIVTLLKGERKVDRPIHKAAWAKQLEPRAVRQGIEQLSRAFEPHVRG